MKTLSLIDLLTTESTAPILLLEAFYGGSHKQLIDSLLRLISNAELNSVKDLIPPLVEVVTLPANKWHWRARTGALSLASIIPRHSGSGYQILFTSSVFSLPELLTLRPDLNCARKYVYFHENQLVFPLRRPPVERDFQYGYNQILTALSADHVFFNSEYNMKSFYEKLPPFLNSGLPIPPSPRVPDVRRLISVVLLPKSSVLYYLVESPAFLRPISRMETSDSLFLRVQSQANKIRDRKGEPLKILWNHRWDYDKNPVDFFKVIYKLAGLSVEIGLFNASVSTLRPSSNISLEESISESCSLASCKIAEPMNFKLCILGEKNQDTPSIFHQAENVLKQVGVVDSWGYLDSRLHYWNQLADCDVVVSTANHEFFGVSIVEAVNCGCVPLCPNRLSYPELMSSKHREMSNGDGCLYSTLPQLEKRLKKWINQPEKLREAAANAFVGIFSQSSNSWLQKSVLPGPYNDLETRYLTLFKL